MKAVKKKKKNKKKTTAVAGEGLTSRLVSERSSTRSFRKKKEKK